ncbi:MAG: YiiX/YebB-like N1pC/P60 family cysteine hydrolase [Cyanobacteriota bacterium]
MKKLLALLISTTAIFSACSKADINSDLVNDTNLEALASTKKTVSQKVINENKDNIQKVAKGIFTNKFADGLKPKTSKNDFDNLNPAFNGEVIFNSLNNNEIDKTSLYLLSDDAVRKEFSKHGTPDSLAKITDTQANQLLSVLKAGDIILCGNDDSFIHTIVYEGNGVIIHSLASLDPKYWGVVKESLKTYLGRSERDKFVVLRAKNITSDDIKKELEFANKQVGKPYDSLFLFNSGDRFYCTELGYQSILAMTTKVRVLPHKEKYGWQIVSNDDFMDSPDFDTVWTLGRERAAIGKNHTY